MIARCVVCSHEGDIAGALPVRCSACGAAQALRLVASPARLDEPPRWRRASLPELATRLEEALARAR